MQSLLQSASRSENHSESASEMRGGTRFVGFQKRYGIFPHLRSYPRKNHIVLLLFPRTFMQAARLFRRQLSSCNLYSPRLIRQFFLRKQTKATPPPKMQIRQRGLYRFFAENLLHPAVFFRIPRVSESFQRACRSRLFRHRIWTCPEPLLSGRSIQRRSP